MEKGSISIVLISLLLFPGCFATTRSGGKEMDPSKAFLCDGPIQDSYAYQLYKDQPKGDLAKIRYIVNLTRYSDRTFYRNGEAYSGNLGARWLEYKINRYAEDCGTVEDFIHKVASHSRKSGKNYYIIFKDSLRSPSRTVFLNELNKLEDYEKSLEEARLEKEAALQAEEISQAVSGAGLSEPLDVMTQDNLNTTLITPLATMAHISPSEVNTEERT